HAVGAAGPAAAPSSPAPGSGATIRLAGRAERTAVAVPAVSGADARLTAPGGPLGGESRIHLAVAAGTYDVRVARGGTGRIGTVTPGARRGRRAAPVRPAPVRPDSGAPTAASPVASVEPGGGARLHGDDEARGSGPGTGHVVTGLVLASVASGAVVFGGARRRGRRAG
ncbi:MAG TPA: hypothetical protein VFP69_20175, partial [Streptomyces sp.]|nr:hypothetical protein [Streptomyces sp.]